MSDSDDSDVSAELSSASDDSVAQRPQINGKTSLLPNGHGSQLQNGKRRDVAPLEHKAGTIVRIKLENFVTYTFVEVYPGPSLNMVIGPNGTGKSTIVCAICLGLGWGPQHLGRAKDAQEFVKHGAQEALIEIELRGDGRKYTSNPIIRTVIKREGNKTLYSIMGKPSNKKNVMQLAKHFSIQIDNLCQFLPQDKVVEFAAMSPIELLRSTQRAVASQEMIDWHDELKDLGTKQRKVQQQNDGDSETYKALVERQKIQEADVLRLRERDAVKEKVRLLEAIRPLPIYKEALNRYKEEVKRRDEVREELDQLEKEVNPSLQAVRKKEMYQKAVQEAVKSRTRLLDTANGLADQSLRAFDTLQSKEQEGENDFENARKSFKDNKLEFSRLAGIITNLQRRLDEGAPEFDVAATNEQIRERDRQIEGILERARSIKTEQRQLKTLGDEKAQQIRDIEAEIQSLDSLAGRQTQRLQRVSQDTFTAWQKVQRIQNEFEQPILGPPMIECSITDPKYVDQVESVIGRGEMITLTAQTRADFRKLDRYVRQDWGLHQVNIRSRLSGLSNFQPPVDRNALRGYSFDGWALDYITGPERVLAMLCEARGLHQTAIRLGDVSTEQYEQLFQSPIASWVTSKSIYAIRRRKEYGPSAVSTNVREVRKANLWSDQPADLGVKAGLEEKKARLEGENTEYSDRINTLNTELQRKDEQKREIEKERKQLEQEKQTKAKAATDFNSLPARIRTSQEKQDAAQQAMLEARDTIKELTRKKNDLVLQKPLLALKYLDAVDGLRKAHADLQDAEIMLICAKSDHEILMERNTTVQALLDTKKEEIKKFESSTKELQAEAKRRVKEIKALMAQEDDKDLSEFIKNITKESPDMTSEQLEQDIDSEKARLELMHEVDGGVLSAYEKRKREIDRLETLLGNYKEALEELDKNIRVIREQWEPRLDKLTKRISESFRYNMEQINCTGEVSVDKTEEFDQWAISIKVKFRESEALTQLDAHRQSGGERAVSTIFYLMSLQSLTRSPFRVVDEINQGMDPRNERLVHSRMVAIATGHDEWRPSPSGSDNEEDSQDEEAGQGSQYFLITPKLLPDLRYERGMKVLCIASGEYMPEQQEKTSFARSLAIRKSIMAEG